MKLRPDAPPSAPAPLVLPPRAGPPAAPDAFEDRVPLWVRPWFICLLLAAVTFAVFYQATSFPFVEFDDQDYVVSNPHVQSGLSIENIAWAFGSSYASNWHPLTWVSHMLDVTLFGPNAAGPHLVNLLLHIANTLLLFAFLRRTTRALWRSAFVAALFALHPLHVESVAWVAERKDVLCTLFGLLALLTYARYAEVKVVVRDAAPPAGTAPSSGEAGAPARPPLFYYALTLLWFALGLMSKPMLVSLPVLLLLLDYWPLRRLAAASWREAGGKPWGVLIEKIPFFFLAAASCGLTLLAQHQGGALRSLTRFSLNVRVGNALVSYARYLGKTFWPVNLSLLYPHPGHWPAVMLALSALLLAVLCLAALLLRRRLPYVFAGWFWFFLALLPVIGLVQVGDQSMADRYMYIPSIGLFAALAWSAAALLARCRLPAAVVAGLGVLVLAACAVRTTNQLPSWRDTESLYRHALAVTGDNPVAIRFLAFHYYNLGNAAREAGDLDEAVARYHSSLALDPHDSLVHNNLGMALQNQGKLTPAIEEYGLAVRFNPTNANARNNLGFALAAAGNLDEAARQLMESLRLNPTNAESHNNLGALFFRAGKFQDAADEYFEAVRLAPGNPGVYDNLGDALARLARTPEAQAAYRKALQLNPNDPVARKRLGNGPPAFKLTTRDANPGTNGR